MNKHTPGPWTIEARSGKRGITCIFPERARANKAEIQFEGLASPFDGCTPIAQVIADEREGCDQIANARLIAAAPQLLNALEALFFLVPEGQSHVLDAALKKAIKAISAATSELAQVEAEGE